MNHVDKDLATKVPAVTLGFWIIKILATIVASTSPGHWVPPWATTSTNRAPPPGGLEFSRPLASLMLAVAMVVLILVIRQRAGRHPGASGAAA